MLCFLTSFRVLVHPKADQNILCNLCTFSCFQCFQQKNEKRKELNKMFLAIGSQLSEGVSNFNSSFYCISIPKQKIEPKIFKERVKKGENQLKKYENQIPLQGVDQHLGFNQLLGFNSHTLKTQFFILMHKNKKVSKMYFLQLSCSQVPESWSKYTT